jgi:hypothetical protein
MPRASSAAVVITILLSYSSVGVAEPSAQINTSLTSPTRPTSPQLTCSPEKIHPDSYRLATQAQALNLTRPRTDWWDGFDFTLGTERDALADLNEGALAIAERAMAIDSRNALAHSQLARQLVVLGEDGDRARAAFAQVFANGGAVVWTATLYDVNARDFFLMAFDQHGIRVYRFGEAVGNVKRHLGVPQFPGPEAMRLWRALGGCVGDLTAEAEVPWSDVQEIKAGNFVLYFKFKTPVTVRSDRGSRKTLREFKVALHGAMGTVEYHVSPGRDRWSEPSIRGIGIGPTAYQDRVRRTLVAVIDPQGRIKLPKASRGAGW